MALTAAKLRLGSNLCADDSVMFLVWAPRARQVELVVDAPDASLNEGNSIPGPPARVLPMNRLENGYYCVQASRARPGAKYFYVLDGKKKRADPASRCQPAGVHGPSQVVSTSFPWTDQSWHGIGLAECIFYEIHTGAFTLEGTFDTIIPRLADLKALGVTMVEIMPVGQFPGNRNWGYDGVFPFAVQQSYGGPCGLKRMVNACHDAGLGATLDVVYNHLGPEGNYLSDFGPYFTDRYRTPWGEALNFDGPESDEVRRYFIENAVYWISEFHFDALRFDAVHAVFDVSAHPFLEELTGRLHGLAEELHRPIHLIAENDRNDVRTVEKREKGGLGFDAQWNDDFHHAFHALVTGERGGYYEDFGGIEHMTRALSGGFVYCGQYSKFRRRRHGSSTRRLPADQLVVFSQNHDQIGNRACGERLSALVSFETQKLAAGIVLLSPFVPLIFMGEEYGETAPFQYFVSHEDAGLNRRVHEGRQAEFAGFGWTGAIPAPEDEETFLRSKLHWQKRAQEPHSILLAFYRELLKLRREIPALSHLDHAGTKANAIEDALVIERSHGRDCTLAFFNFSDCAAALPTVEPAYSALVAGAGEAVWNKQLDSAALEWKGPGATTPPKFAGSAPAVIEIPARSFSLYHRNQDAGGKSP